MENLESHEILKNYFPGLESHGFFYLVMENISLGYGNLIKVMEKVMESHGISKG